MGRPEQLEPEPERDRVGRRAPDTTPHSVADVRRRSVFADAEETACQRDDQVKGEHASMGERASIVDHHAAGALDELVTEAALARARLRGDQHDSRSARPRLAQNPLEQSELGLPADEAREAARARALEAAPNLAGTPQLEHPHGNARALETVLTTIEEVEEAR